MILQLMIIRVIGLPVWWYGRGLMDVILWSMHTVSTMQKQLALRLWMKNLFVPMYGDDSVTGRMISFFVRLISIVLRGIGVIVFACALIVLCCVYLVLPVFVVLGFMYHAQSLV